MYPFDIHYKYTKKHTKMMRFHDIIVGGIRVMQNFHETDNRTNPLVVCIHGNSSCAETFLFLMNEITRTEKDRIEKIIDVIALDLPGCGRSKRLDSYSCQSVGQMIADLLKNNYNADNRDVYYVGHSLGGHLEAFVDVRKKGVVLMGTPPLSGASDFQFAFAPNDEAKSLIPLLSKEAAFTDDEARKFVEHTFSDCEEGRKKLTKEENEIMNLMVDYAKGTDGRFRKGCLETLASVNQKDALERRNDGSVVIIHGLKDGVISLDYLNSISKECLYGGAIHTIDSHHMIPILESRFVANMLNEAFF